MALIDSQSTVLSFAVEKDDEPGVLPDSPVWRGILPNSYSSFGGTIETVASAPLEPSKQNIKGSVTQIAATSGFEVDLKLSNMERFLPGLFSSRYVEKGSNDRIRPATNTATTITRIAATTITGTGFSEANGWVIPVGGKLLVMMEGFLNPTNNGLKTVSSLTATTLTFDSGQLAAETNPRSTGRIYVVGFEAKTGETAIPTSVKTVSLTTEFTANSPFIPVAGEWINLYNQTDSEAIGWIRVRGIDAARKVITVDIFAGTAPDPAISTGKVIRFFYANRYINNPTADTVKTETYQFERRIDFDADTDTGNYQVVTGSRFNTMALNVATADKITAQMDFISQDSSTPTTATASSIVEERLESIFNASADVKQVVMYNHNDKGGKFFTDLSDVTLNVDNGITPQYAVGTPFSVGSSSGNFGFTMSATAYFESVEAIESVRDNADVGIYLIVQNEDGGFVLDVPLVQITTADVTIAVGEPVQISVESSAFRGDEGYTARWSIYKALPVAAA